MMIHKVKASMLSIKTSTNLNILPGQALRHISYHAVVVDGDGDSISISISVGESVCHNERTLP